jgi:hypothetical protein
LTRGRGVSAGVPAARLLRGGVKRRQPLQQFDGLEREMRRPIRPAVPQFEHDPPVWAALQPLVRDRRA